MLLTIGVSIELEEFMLAYERVVWEAVRQYHVRTVVDQLQKPSLFRTLLVLGRVSNLPTVWSNCLAGWLIGGAGDWVVFGRLCLGASLLYVGGMFLNDACDEAYDQEHRPERPLPSNAISRQSVWLLSNVALGCGALLLIFIGRKMILPTLGLLACIIVYDAVHKRTGFAPVLMAGCRFLLYVVAGAAAAKTAIQPVLWAASAMALYVLGLSCLARREATGTQINGWPLPLLVSPVLLAVVQGGRGAGEAVLWLVLLGWVLFSLTPLRTPRPGVVGKVVSRLLAGIVIVDMLAAPDVSGPQLVAFALLFGGALLLQKTVPAT